MAERVTVRMDNGVADVRLNRPEKMNALDGAMFRALVETGEALKADPSVRAVVLSGEGRSFCAGLDLTSFQAMAGDQGMEIGAEPKGDRITNQGQQAAYVWAEMPAPARSRSAATCATAAPTPPSRCSRSAGASPPT